MLFDYLQVVPIHQLLVLAFDPFHLYTLMIMTQNKKSLLVNMHVCTLAIGKQQPHFVAFTYLYLAQADTNP